VDHLYVDFGVYAHLQRDTYVKRDLYSWKETYKRKQLQSNPRWITCMLTSASTRTYSTTHTWTETYIQEVKKEQLKRPTLHLSFSRWITCMLTSASMRTYSATHMSKETYIKKVKKNQERNLLCTYLSVGGSLVCCSRCLRAPAVRICQKRPIFLERDLQKRPTRNPDFGPLYVDDGVFCHLYAHLQRDTYVKRDLYPWKKTYKRDQ